ncbi:MAG: cyclic pyranopterin monophosphate synthase MoaC, partial [Gammaproteobacteria bacterium]|nr:cyclic pyranopterin monophosphate synthase MoaC [Gammaproteobacteria bacterium]
MSDLTHLDKKGAAQMVDITDKEISHREAIATSYVSMSGSTLEKVVNQGIAKG